MGSIALSVTARVSAQSDAAKVLDTWGDSLTIYKVSGTTHTNLVRPQFTQRGVNMDGSLRLPSVQGWALAANPFSESAAGLAKLGDVHLDTGTYAPTEVDLALPSIGPGWVIGRSYNGVQMNSTNTAFAQNQSFQGNNWFQLAQPELIFVAGSSADRDMLYLVYGADRFIEFKRTGVSATTFKSLNGAAGVVAYAAGSGGAPATYTYTDQLGTESVFFAEGYDDGTNTYVVDGQLWKITDANGKTAYVGDATNAITAITSGYYPNGRIIKAFDSADRRYTYTYQSNGLSAKLTQVLAETKTGGTWASPTGLTEVGRVQYDYYGSLVSGQGSAGDLKLVTITTPLSPSATSLVRKQYYRYYTSNGYNATTNPGYIGMIKMVVGHEGVRKYDWLDTNLADTLTDLDAASDATLTPYSSVVLEYYDNALTSPNGNRYIKKAVFNGECGCSGGGGNGTHEFTYDRVATYTTRIGGTTYDTGWSKRTVVKRPDLTYETQYFDEVSQPLSRVTTGQDPTGSISTWWAISVTRDSSGLTTEIGTPESVSAYTHSTGTLTEAGSTGLISVIERQTTGDMIGLPIGRQFRQAGGSTKTYESSADLIAGTELTAFTKTISGAVAVIRPLADDQRVYPVATSSRTDSTANLTSVALTAHSGSVMIASATSTLPSITTGNNGSGASNTRSSYATIDGRTAFTKNEEGIIGFRAYDTATGQLKTSIQDADTSNADVTSVMSAPTGFTSSGTALHYKTTYSYDAQGRMETSTSPDGRVSRMYYTKLGDGRMVTLSIPRDSSGTYSGPVGYSITNHAGKTEAQGVIGLSSGTSTAALNTWITTSATNPVSALAVGTLVRLSTTEYDSSGHKAQSTRTYFSIPAGGSWPGNSTSNFDETAYGYDDMGRTRRVKSPAGDISRTVFDALGRVTERWLGTNDASFAGGESSGTDNMTKVEILEYDSGVTAKNSRLTSRTQDPDGNWGTTTDQRVTSMIYDFRGRVIVTTNPLAPHSVSAYDNLGRMTGWAQYTSTSGLTSAAVPTTTSNRIAYRESVFDELGRVWKSTRHKITQSSGSSADTIDTLTWFDPVGRVIKVRGENQHAKTRFDRLGRAVQQFTLSSDNDTTYANVYTSGKTDVVGDTIVEQSSTGYDNTNKTGLALVRSQVSRHWNDSTTTGELDSNADGVDTTITAANVKGRVQISAMWYDNLNRLTDTVNLGTNAIVGDGSTSTGTYTRGTTVTSGQPSRSDTALRTSYVYDSAGVVQDVTDPRNLTSRTEYDQAGRRTATVANHTGASTPLATANRDNDLYTRYTYDKGRQTEMWVDLDGDGAKDSDDQVTTYVFGVTKSSSLLPSYIASNSALRATIYPDSAATSASIESGSSTDAVVMSYTALSQLRSRRDQIGNVFDYTFDALGRETSRAVTTLGSGVDGSVRRIETAYLTRGLPNTMTQYNAASAGTATDQVQYSYDDWGNLTKFDQDVDSAIGVSGRAAFDVEYAWTKSAPSGARTVLRRTTMTMPNNATVTYGYASSGVVSDLSLVEKLTLSSVDIASYKYLGRGTLVKTTLDQPNLSTDFSSSTTGVYPSWDQFNRIIDHTWKKGSATFYDVDITYDRNSNILAVQDNIHKTAANGSTRAFDAEYGVDNINRLTKALFGNLSGTSLSSQTSGEKWLTDASALTLSQTGNWETYRVATSGSTFTDESRVHASNEISTISGISFAHDANGNLTSQGSYGPQYRYVFDAFNRLRKITKPDSTLVQEFRYNGLGYRIAWLHDATSICDPMAFPPAPGGPPDGVVDSMDPWFYITYDEKWRMVATYREDDANPKEQFYAHSAGVAGLGGSSYIDSVILRDRDAVQSSMLVCAVDGWPLPADDSLEERRYYAQNWRSDVAAVLTESGRQVEQIRYGAYGLPWGLPAGDLNADGDADAGDLSAANTLIGASQYDVRADINLDGVLNTSDTAIYPSTTLGRGVISDNGTLNRKGYAGYELTGGSIADIWHVRHRVMHTGLGRWIQRDPAGYVDGANLVRYARTNPLTSVDPTGLFSLVVSSRSAFTRSSWIGGVNLGNDGRLTSEEKRACCEQMTELGDFGPQNAGLGLTICCRGEAISCNWTRLHPEWFTNPEPGVPEEPIAPGAMPIIQRCIDRHESIHVANARCDPNRPEPYTLSPGESHIPVNPDCEECVAYGVEAACLAGGIIMCGTDLACIDSILYRIAAALEHQRSYCAQCIQTPWVERSISPNNAAQ